MTTSLKSFPVVALGIQSFLHELDSPSPFFWRYFAISIFPNWDNSSGKSLQVPTFADLVEDFNWQPHWLKGTKSVLFSIYWWEEFCLQVWVG
jgi:hypothetical protein